MKRCPECRRDYYDDSLLYCLDDGNALLEGPATGSTDDDPTTAILHSTDAPGEAPTREQIHTTNQTAVLPSAGEAPSTRRRPDKKLRVMLGAIFAVLLITGIGFGIYKYGGSKPAIISFESAKITRLTNSGKVGGSVALSPDAKWLIYSVFDGENESLWLKQVAIPNSNTQIVPPAAVGYAGTAFSHDGNYLYYTAFDGPTGATLYQMPVLGGTARKLISGVSGGMSFSPDGKQITYGVEDIANDESILMAANADGSEPRRIVMQKGNDEIGSSRGRWSPDGKTIALFAGTNIPHDWDVATVSVSTGEITRLKTNKFNFFDTWEWLPDGKSLLFLATEKNAQNAQFWQVSYPSGEVKKVSNDLNTYTSLSLAADANVLATVQTVSTSNIWTAPIGDTAKTTQVTSGSDPNGDPAWTPDGKLVFARASGSNWDIYIVEANGGTPKQLTSNASSVTPIVSPDGRYIIYVSAQSGTSAIWRMNIDGSNAKQLTSEVSYSSTISSNGQEIIYSAGTDTSRIWKIGIDGGQPVQLTNVHSLFPVFSPDGKQFACFWLDDPNAQAKLAIIPSEGGMPVKTFSIPSFGLRWMPDGRSVVYIVNKGNVGNIWSQPLDGGKPKQLTNFTSELIRSFDLSRDGKQIAVSRGTDTRDVVLISGIKK